MKGRTGEGENGRKGEREKGFSIFYFLFFIYFSFFIEENHSMANSKWQIEGENEQELR